jgi:hypothetical protein
MAMRRLTSDEAADRRVAKVPELLKPPPIEAREMNDCSMIYGDRPAYKSSPILNPEEIIVARKGLSTLFAKRKCRTT